ncbi:MULTISPECIES: H-NS family nucleoid-associated regulatory protein [Paracoccus]|uniref:H-NS histone family protein n=1 Tax=Paracoccus litorisediminis TaxID=2006130 RepID=A0A844HGS8_9RHOB|nr:MULTISPECIES: H-NS histone family protein [Paracoccus]MBD9528113.1 H-NS histone family protein [Paracoccus sp. PAR01]MTH59183.1 H-NS histone family protein [Paracoccus litorisediminis]
MELDLDQMSLRELRDLRNKVEKSISTFEDRRKREALAAVENAAREFGFTFADLADVKPARGKVAAKYADPANPDATWTGRGRKPRWVVEALDAGKSMADLEI